MKHFGFPRWAPLLMAALVGVLIGVVVATAFMQPQISLVAPAHAQAVGPETQEAIVAAIEQAAPAVVNISTVTRRAPRFGLPGFFEEPVPRQGQASGVIIDAQGHVLTSNHVVRDATTLTVTLADGRSFDAAVVGRDPMTDIAVVRVEGDDLPVARLGSSADKPIGSWLIAIGNPFGYQSTATVGVLSARGRSLRAETGVSLENLLQTDAAINPGNSGGALVDLKGEVVGIPTAIIPFAQGIGFAIPAEDARRVADQLIQTGRIIHPWLGVRLVTVDEVIQREYDLPVARGVWIVGVVLDGPAHQAGIEEGDVIVRLDRQEVARAEQVTEIIAQSRPGQVMPVTVARGDQRLDLSVTVGERPLELP